MGVEVVVAVGVYSDCSKGCGWPNYLVPYGTFSMYILVNVNCAQSEHEITYIATHDNPQSHIKK